MSLRIFYKAIGTEWLIRFRSAQLVWDLDNIEKGFDIESSGFVKVFKDLIAGKNGLGTMLNLSSLLEYIEV